MAKEPTLSDALKNADKAAAPTLLEDMEGYMTAALAMGGQITEAADTPAGYAVTTWHFPAIIENGPGTEGRASYDDVVYTAKHFPQTPDEADAQREAVSAAIEAALNPDYQETAEPLAGTAEPVALPETSHYSSPLRDHLKAQSIYYDDEIARLARLTENAMKAQSAVHNALSSLDRDGL